MRVSSVILILSLAVSVNAGLTGRIIDGTVAKSGEIPYQVSLQLATLRKHFCGGSILNDYYVLTAAHCVGNLWPDILTVVAGTVNLRKPAWKYPVEKIYVHEEYNSKNAYANDIALVKVKNRFQRSNLISFAPLPLRGDIAKANDSAVVSGFGTLTYEGETTNLLHWVKIQVANQTYCNLMYRNIIHETQLCAYDPTAVRGHCNGDSGGPLMVNGKLHGIVSWSNKCANIKYPSVYTRVSSYLDWIERHTAK